LILPGAFHALSFSCPGACRGGFQPGRPAGCDAQRISELQPGISTEADVRDRFGVPETIWDEAGGARTWNTTASPPGRSIT
jgi:hypothetical protein